jgi:hypothetical protein
MRDKIREPLQDLVWGDMRDSVSWSIRDSVSWSMRDSMPVSDFAYSLRLWVFVKRYVENPLEDSVRLRSTYRSVRERCLG